MKILKDRSNAFLGMALIILIVYPFFNDSRSMMILLTQVFIFGIFAMSYDLLLGYTGIVSFGHAMFFGIGAYSTGIFLDRMEPTMFWLVVSILTASVIAGIVSYVVGLLTLRLKSHFYAMLTLAFAGLFLVGAEKWRSLTFGNDGFTFRTPDVLKDRLVFYFVCLGVMVIIFLLLKRFTHSPAGSVLQAIRENEQRAESIGFQVLHYKILASVIAGVVACFAGSLYSLSLRFVNTSVFTMDVTLDALLMTIIGGVGTLIGPMVGAGLIEFAHHYLTELAKTYPIFERWIIFFGILYILAVMFFPAGIVGSFKKIKKRKRTKEKDREEKNIAS